MILVTGGAGFIGSAWVWYLNQLGETDILIVDKLGTSEKWKNLVPLKYSDYIEKEDFLVKLKNGDYKRLFKEVYHLGAQSATYEKDATYLIKNNFEFSKDILEYCDSEKIKMVYASSAATYGGSEVCSDQTSLQNLVPLNMYAYSKHMFDLYVQNKGKLKDVAGLKFFNVWGPNEYHKTTMPSIVLKTFNDVMDYGQAKLFKSYKPEYKHGEQLRDFIYIKDLIRMMAEIRKSEISGIINLGSGKAISFIELVNSVFEALDVEPDIKFIDMPEGLKEKYQYYTKSDVSKYMSYKLDFYKTPVKEAVKDYVSNYLIPHKFLGQTEACSFFQKIKCSELRYL